MGTYDNSMAGQFAQLLARRTQELHRVLAGEALALGTGARDVMDFKDVAVEETLAVVDEAQAAQASRELDQVLAAQRRLADHSYGYCLDCGDPIDVRRLSALPGTAYCTSCQSIHEHERTVAARH